MAARPQFLQDRSRNAILDLHPADFCLNRVAADKETGRLDRLLRRHPAVDHAENDFVHRRGNPVVACRRDGEPRCERSTLYRRLEDQRRDAGRRRAREWKEPARRAAAAGPQVVVVQEAEPFGDVKRSTPRAERLRHRNHVAIRIRHRKRRRPASNTFGRKIARRIQGDESAATAPAAASLRIAQIPRRFRGIDALEQRCRVRLLEMRPEIDLEERRIGGSRT
jgi:hypothetical protein